MCIRDRSFGSTGTLGTFSVANNGDNTFTVTLSGGKGEQMVFYRTVNGSAVGGTHFEHKSGVLVFKEGETQKTIAVTENNPNSTYNGNAATGYSNAARTYSLELYRTCLLYTSRLWASGGRPGEIADWKWMLRLSACAKGTVFAPGISGAGWEIGWPGSQNLVSRCPAGGGRVCNAGGETEGLVGHHENRRVRGCGG